MQVDKRVTLGWIKPDDNDRPDHDCYKLEKWLGDRDLKGISAIVRTSKSSGIHAKEELFHTGEAAALIAPAQALADAGADVVVWACTSASFIGGLGWSREQAAGIARAIGKPVTSTSLAILDAAKQLDVKAVDLLGTYPDEITAVLAGYMEDGGLRVEYQHALNAPTGKAAFALDLCEEAARFAQMNSTSRNPVVIPDTAANSLDLLTELERILRRPVITAVQASLWHGLMLLGIKPSIERGGLLFRGEPWKVAA
jgi:maleate cis-trans isomerase